MKKIILILAAAMLLAGCKKETSYTLEYEDGFPVAANIMIYQFNKQNDIVEQSYFYQIIYPFNAKIITVENAEKCKVTIGFNEWSIYDSTDDKWVNEIFYLEKDKNIRIKINKNTQLQSEEP